MKVLQVNEHDAVNSITGFTMSIWFSGCSHMCKGCFSKNTWDYENGESISLDSLKNYIKNSFHKNVSLLGGDPLYYKNRENVIELIEWIKENTDKTIYVWTGYTYDQLISDDIMKKETIDKIDFLIEGRFIESQKDLSLKLRGSKNQRVFKNGRVFNV